MSGTSHAGVTKTGENAAAPSVANCEWCGADGHRLRDVATETITLESGRRVEVTLCPGCSV